MTNPGKQLLGRGKVWEREEELIQSPKASEGYMVEKGEDKQEMVCMLCQLFELFSESISFGGLGVY